MFLKISPVTHDLLIDAECYFSIEYRDTVSSVEGLIGRYMVSKHLESVKKFMLFLPQIDKFGAPVQYEDIHWSISHKKDLVLVGVDKSKIGVDIEIFRERDDQLLSIFTDTEYAILGEKNWENFYILWTLKESVIKYHQITLEEMSQIVLIKSGKKLIKICGIQFNIRAILEYRGIRNVAISGKTDAIFYSVCCLNQ